MSGLARRVAVICGGPGEEHDVSLASGRAIAAALRELGCEVVTCVVSRELAWQTDGHPGLEAAIAALRSADVAMPALHGRWGEDGTLQGFLDTLEVAYVGSGVAASAMCMDKARTKVALAAAGIRVAPGRTVDASVTSDDLAILALELGLPLFVKPLRGGSSFGVTRVTRLEDLHAAIATATVPGDGVLVEAELRGREIDLGVLQLPDGSILAGPALEIQADPGEPFFSTAAKYASDRTRFIVPAPVADPLGAELAEIARRAFGVLGCVGLARVDFFVDERWGPVVNEVNTMPGFTEQSQFPRMWSAAGMAFPALVQTLLDTALAGRYVGRAA